MPDAQAEVAVATLMFTALAYSVMAWLWIANRWWQGLPLLKFEPRRTPPWGILDFAVLLLAWLLLQVMLVFFVRAACGLSPAPNPTVKSAEELRAMMLGALWADLLAGALIVVWLRWVRGASLADLGLSGPHLAGDVLRGVVAFTAIVTPVYGLQFLLTQFFPSHHPALELLKESRDPATVLITVLMAAIVAPICEELLFRLVMQGGLEAAEARYLQRRLRRKTTAAPDGLDGAGLDERHAAPRDSVDVGWTATSPSADAVPQSVERPADTAAIAAPEMLSPEPRLWGLRPGAWPILASSAAFALMHLGHGPDPIPLFVLALALGYLYRQTHRLLPSILVHVLLNSCSLAMLWLFGGN